MEHRDEIWVIHGYTMLYLWIIKHFLSGTHSPKTGTTSWIAAVSVEVFPVRKTQQERISPNQLFFFFRFCSLMFDDVEKTLIAVLSSLNGVIQ